MANSLLFSTRILVHRYQTFLSNGVKKKEALRSICEENKYKASQLEIEGLINRYEQINEETLGVLQNNNGERSFSDNLKLSEKLSEERLVLEQEVKEIDPTVDNEEIGAVFINKALLRKSSLKVNTSTEVKPLIESRTQKGKALVEYSDFFEKTTELLIGSLESEEGILEAVKKNRSELEIEIEKWIDQTVKGNSYGIEYIETLINKNHVLELSDQLKLRIEAALKTSNAAIDKWMEDKTDLVNVLRRDGLEETIIERMLEGGRNEKDVSQTEAVLEYGKLLTEVYFFKPDDDKQKREVIEAVKLEGTSEGQIEKVWHDVKTMSSVLKMRPGDLKKFLSRYSKVKANLGNNILPVDISQVRAFENMMSFCSNNPQAMNVINLTQKYVRFFDFFAGPNKMSRMGAQSMVKFMGNSIKVLNQQGKKKGTEIILKQILSGGLKVVGGAAKSAGGAASLAGAQAIPVAGQIALVLTVVYTGYKKFIKPVLDKLKTVLKKLGVDLTGMKIYLQNNFGKFFGGIIDFGIKAGALIIGIPVAIGGVITALAVGPIITFIFIGILIYSMLNSNLISSLVPPVRISSSGDTAQVDLSGLPDSCPSIWPVDKGCITSGVNSIWTHAGLQAIDIGCVNRFQAFYATHDGLAKPFYTPGCGYGVDVYGTCNGKQFYTHYCHGPYSFLKGPTQVKKGQQIGVVDNKGISTGDHVHYDLKVLGDINNYLPQKIKAGCIGFVACGSIRITSLYE